jgi:DNA modification methylase/superfamily II DNA or RNA helicase
MTTDYARFLASKRLVVPAAGKDIGSNSVNGMLFPFQADLTRWSVRKGRAAIFADTGLGKTFMQLEWARLIGGRSLIIAPLSVARQTVGEGRKIGIDVRYERSGGEADGGITITNYEMADHFDPAAFDSVVLDESSILKALDGKTRAKLTEMFAETPYRLCCTATPAPNDITEIANHAEFLGIMPRADMLASFFVHDDEGWRLKGHAEEPFYRWLASWGMSITRPSDLGYDDDGFILPALNAEPVWVESDYVPEGMMFAVGLDGIQGRQKVRRATIEQRVNAAAALVDDDQWLFWCGLNDEGRELHKRLPGSVLVEGSQSAEEKALAIEAFQDGKTQILITKPKIAGFGMNLQNCHNMAFVGLSDSWEAYYQCIRRCWRFGQEHPVNVAIVLSEAERPIYENVMGKETEALLMRQRLIENVQEFERAEIGDASQDWEYQESEDRGAGYRLLLGDASTRLAEVEDETVGLSVFSPPFLSLYTYTPTERDIGNSRTESEFYEHFGYIMDGLMRVTKPGRLCCVHVAQVPAQLARDGYIGLKDFRGATVEAFERKGWIFHGEVTIDKDPQAQAIRTKSKALLFKQLRKDASWLRPALADYILVFRKPGENIEPIRPDISNEDWISWARPIWYGIRESDTLNVREGRSERDERHIAPLQLGTIERCIRLWSNPGDTILSPFAGIGSEGYVAIRHGREFVGIELKEGYYNAAKRNLRRAVDVREGQMQLDIAE